MRRRLAIFGAGGFGREVLTLVRQIDEVAASADKFDLIGWYDDGLDEGQLVDGLPVLGGIGELQQQSADMHLALGLGDPGLKRKIVASLQGSGVRFPSLVHPDVAVRDYQRISIGEGTIITPGNLLTTNITLGRFNLLNLACTVGHDTVIGDFCSFMPGVNISGDCVIGEGVYVGTGAAINNEVSVAENVVVGSGAVVTKDLPAGVTAVGIPAKPLGNR